MASTSGLLVSRAQSRKPEAKKPSYKKSAGYRRRPNSDLRFLGPGGGGRRLGSTLRTHGARQPRRRIGRSSLFGACGVLFGDPGYPVYASGAILAGGEAIPVPLRRDTNFLIDLDAIKGNVTALREHVGAAAVMAVVKSDAYGHGMVPAARAALAGGASGIGVITVPEALTLRRAGVSAPVLCLMGVPGTAHEEAVRQRVDLSAGSVGLVREIAAIKSAAKTLERGGPTRFVTFGRSTLAQVTKRCRATALQGYFFFLF